MSTSLRPLGWEAKQLAGCYGGHRTISGIDSETATDSIILGGICNQKKGLVRSLTLVYACMRVADLGCLHTG